MSTPTDPLNDLEARLQRLRPARATLDRDRVLFESGRAAAQVESSTRIWRGATIGLLVTVLALSGWLVQERSGRVATEHALAELRRQSTTTPEPPTLVVQEPAPAEVAPTSYLALSRRWSRGDVESLAVGDAPPPAEASTDDAPGLSPLQSRNPSGILEL